MRERFILTLAANGVPVDTVSAAHPFAVTYQRPLSGEEQARADALIAAFDPSPEAQAAWEESRRLEQVKQTLTSQDPVPKAARAGLLALMLSLQECRAKVNEVVAWAGAQGATIAPLETGTTFDEAIDTVRMLLDAGVVS